MPNLEHETEACARWGITYVAGLDEAGRGAIAGPVVAAAVILPLHDPQRLARLASVNDSKQLSSARREELFQLIIANALAYGIGRSSAQEIDQLGILPANVQAMERALAQLEPAAAGLLLDGRMRLRRVNLPQISIVRGDSASLSIAAASILAKVTRDREMIHLDRDFSAYGFAQHKGYCTRSHQLALERHGPCAVHRYTFAPIRQPLFEDLGK